MTTRHSRCVPSFKLGNPLVRRHKLLLYRRVHHVLIAMSEKAVRTVIVLEPRQRSRLGYPADTSLHRISPECHLGNSVKHGSLPPS